MYERNLIEYLPPFERDIKEFDAILTKGEQPEMVSLWESVDNVLNDQFIMDATENGVSRLEKIMKIVPKANETLDARKFTLLTKTSEQRPFTIVALEKQMEALCGKGDYEIIRDVVAKTLHVKVGLAAKSNFNDVSKLLERIVPANMIIDLTLKYKQYGAVGTYTHEALKSFTHDDIRNEVE